MMQHVLLQYRSTLIRSVVANEANISTSAMASSRRTTTDHHRDKRTSLTLQPISHSFPSFAIRQSSQFQITQSLPNRTYSLSSGLLDRPSEDRKDININHKPIDVDLDATNCTDSHAHNNTSNTTTPLDQRASNAILKQLSSPPNLLTLSRIIATPYLSYMLISHNNSKEIAADVDVGNAIGIEAIDASASNSDAISTISTSIDFSSTPIFALSLFLAMGFTDFLDGYIARTFPSTATVLGTYLDPFADKVFINVMSLTLWFTGTLPGMLVGLWVVRDLGMLSTTYWVVRKETSKKHNDDDSENIAVMDPQRTPLKVQASFMSKVNTTLQIGLIALGIAGELPFVDIPPEYMTGLCCLTAGTTIGSSLGYLDGSAMLKSGNK